MYLIIGTVEMIAKKPETMTFPWVVISQAGGVKERRFMTIHWNYTKLIIEVDFSWKVQAQNLPAQFRVFGHEKTRSYLLK